jgi:hypothetical protein
MLRRLAALTVRVIAIFVFAMPALADDNQGPSRTFSVTVVGARTADESRDIAQQECVVHFFGDDIQPGFGGDGTLLVGTTFRHTSSGVKWNGVFGLGASFALAVRVRIDHTLCEDPDGTGTMPPPTRYVSVPYKGNGQTFVVFQLGLASLGLTDFNLSPKAFSAALFVMGGVEHEWIWWSRPGDFGSKKMFFLGASLMVGDGTVVEKNDSYGAGFLGLAIRLGVRY